MRTPKDQRKTNRISAVDFLETNPGLQDVITDIGKKLREMRGTQGWSAREFAIRAGYQGGDGSLSRAEKGKDPGISIHRLYRYASSMGYTVEVNFVKKGRKR